MNSALQTAAAIRDHTTTARAETDAAIARIESTDGPINAVPVTTNSAGLPVGVQVICPAHHDHRAISIAKAINSGAIP